MPNVYEIIQRASYSIEHQTELKGLAVASSRVLDNFHAGQNPTFQQLERLECALAPFVMEKICGHAVLEDCDCY